MEKNKALENKISTEIFGSICARLKKMKAPLPLPAEMFTRAYGIPIQAKAPRKLKMGSAYICKSNSKDNLHITVHATALNDAKKGELVYMMLTEYSVY